MEPSQEPESPKTLVEVMSEVQAQLRNLFEWLGFEPVRPSMWSRFAAALRTPLGWAWLVILGIAIGVALAQI